MHGFQHTARNLEYARQDFLRLQNELETTPYPRRLAIEASLRVIQRRLRYYWVRMRQYGLTPEQFEGLPQSVFVKSLSTRGL